MGRLFLEFLHKLFTAVLGVGLGMAAVWYSQDHHANAWVVGAAGAGIALVVSALFHPFMFAWRHRPRRPLVVDDATD
jgi:glycerol uptake facilitator-like aquaporin